MQNDTLSISAGGLEWNSVRIPPGNNSRHKSINQWIMSIFDELTNQLINDLTKLPSGNTTSTCPSCASHHLCWYHFSGCSRFAKSGSGKINIIMNNNDIFVAMYDNCFAIFLLFKKILNVYLFTYILLYNLFIKLFLL